MNIIEITAIKIICQVVTAKTNPTQSEIYELAPEVTIRPGNSMKWYKNLSNIYSLTLLYLYRLLGWLC